MLQFLVLGAALASLACEPPAPPAAPSSTSPAPPAPAPGAPSAELVRARLVADTTAVAPGAERMIGVSLELADGWHVYAQARNDTGAPVRVTLTAPAALDPAPVFGYPMPRRHVAPGGLLDHVYEQAVTLPAHFTVPQDWAPGSSVTLRAHVEWFVCRDVCVPGATDLTLALPVVALPDEQRLSPEAPALREAESRLPRPLADKDPAVTLELHDDELQLRAAGAAGMLFVPANDCANLPQLRADGEGTGETLTLHLDPQRPPDAAVVGALEVRRHDGPTEYHALRCPAPPAASS